MEEELPKIPSNRLANVASRAVGVGPEAQTRRWVIGVVLNNTEISSRNHLIDLGYEAYVPTQTHIRVWNNGRKKKSEKIYFKNWVFLHVTEPERQEAVNTPWVKRCYEDKTRSKSAECPALVIPDDQMERMRFILSNAQAPVEISDRSFRKGDQIQVARGQLAGLTGYVVQDNDGRHSLIVELGLLGNAKVQIEISDVISIK